MPRPIVKSRYDSHRALSKVTRAHASKVAFKTGMPLSKVRWLTRKTGTDEQRGKHFPILGSKADLPKPSYPSAWRMDRKPDKLETEAMKTEKELIDAGFKGFTLGILYKNGKTEEIPIVAKNYADAMKKFAPIMAGKKTEDIKELVIIDPKIGEILRKLGHGAVAAARKIAGVAKKVYKKGEAEALKAARRVGRISALPEEMREAYEVGRARRPGIIPAEAGEPARRVLTPDEAARLVAEAMRGAPLTEAEKAEIEKYPLLYRPREEPPPYTVEELRAAQKVIAERRAAEPRVRLKSRLSPVSESYFTERHYKRRR